MLLSIDTISKHYGDNLILSQVSFNLDVGQKIGLVGANGVGKSTLLKIIMGEVEADSGSTTIQAHTTVGYLPQLFQNGETVTVTQLLNHALGDLTEMEKRLRQLEAAMGQAPDDLEKILAEYGRLSERYERRGGYDLAHRRREIMAGMQVEHLASSRPVNTLSGGEKSRIGMAALLLRSPDLLLLDEPSNHLDFGALAWLEDFLHNFKGGLLAVSHDRHFLIQTVDSMIEIDEHTKQAKFYSGNYEFYAAAKAQERRSWETSYQSQQEEIRVLRQALKGNARQIAHNRAPKDGDKMLANFKAHRIDTAVSRNVRAVEEKLRRIEADPIPRPPRQLTFHSDFDPATLNAAHPLMATGISKRYGDQLILSESDLSIAADSRIVIIGPNGAGKSTLLRLLAGLTRPDTGNVSTAAGVIIGYLDQEQGDLMPDATVYETFQGDRAGDDETFKAELLSYGLFTYPDLAKEVGTLSIGQQRKLQLARLLTQRANLLLLDEPTNHISLDVLEEFEDALSAFAGPIVAVSHDRRFIQRFAREIWHIEQGHVTRHLGTWDEFAKHL